MPEEKKYEITLNEFDDEGNVVDTSTAELTMSQISDIVDHAAQLVILHRDDKPFGDVLSNLDEALSVAGVLPHPPGSAPSPG